MEASFKAANETYAEINAPTRRQEDLRVADRIPADAYLWQQFSEYTFDAFMMGQQRKKAL